MIYTLFIADDNIDHGDKLYLTMLLTQKHGLTSEQAKQLFDNHEACFNGVLHEVVMW